MRLDRSLMRLHNMVPVFFEPKKKKQKPKMKTCFMGIDHNFNCYFVLLNFSLKIISSHGHFQFCLETKGKEVGL